MPVLPSPTRSEEFRSSAPVSDSRTPGVLVGVFDPVRRSEIAGYLTAIGCVVWETETGLEALSTFFSHTGEVDAFLLDAGLPDLPAPAFLRRLVAHFPGVPCVFLANLPQAAELKGYGTRTVSRTADAAEITEAVLKAVATDSQFGM